MGGQALQELRAAQCGQGFIGKVRENIQKCSTARLAELV